MKKFDTTSDALNFAKKHGAQETGNRVNFPRPVGLKVLGVVDFLRLNSYYFVTFEE